MGRNRREADRSADMRGSETHEAEGPDEQSCRRREQSGEQDEKQTRPLDVYPRIFGNGAPQGKHRQPANGEEDRGNQRQRAG